MLLLLRAVYPRAIVDQITVRGNGRENPVEIGLLVLSYYQELKKCAILMFSRHVIIFKAVVEESKVTLIAFICVFCFFIFIF